MIYVFWYMFFQSCFSVLLNNNFCILIYIMRRKITLLYKQIFSYISLLVFIDSKIYCLKIEPKKDFLMITQIYMLEEIPNPSEIKQRLTHYIINEAYQPVKQFQTEDYLTKIKQFLEVFVNGLSKSELRKFDDLYINANYHPDLISFYKSMNDPKNIQM